MQETSKFSLSSDGSLGVFTTVALILLLWGFCWLKNSFPFQARQRINVMFTDVAGLHTSAAVFADGVRAGSVEKVTWQNNNQVLVCLKITHPRIRIPQGAQFNILANGIIGSRYVDITLPSVSESTQIPLDESTIVMGGEVLRPEMILEKIGSDIEKIDIDALKTGINQDRKILRHTANQFSLLSTRAIPVMDRALPLEDSLASLSSEMRITLAKLNKFSDNPKLSPELRETVEKARQTAEIAQMAIRDLNNMVADKSLRHDIGETMSHLNQSTAQFEQSMETLQQVSKDTNLRSDVKEILLDARQALDKLERILNNPESGSDVRGTLRKTRDTLTNIDTVALQLQQILDKRHPLIHMFLGRPGHINTSDINQSAK